MKMQEDENRRLNQVLEDAVQGLQQAPTQEQLAHTLTVVRRAMQAGGQWIAAVETTPGASAALRPQNCADRRRRALVVCLHLV